MLIYLICFAIMFFIFTIVGKSFVLKIDSYNYYDTFDSFFIGISITGSFLNLSSLFFPTDGIALILLILISIVLFYYLYKKNTNIFKNQFNILCNYYKNKKYYLLAIVLITLIILFSSLVYPKLFDSDFYHIAAIRWNELYSVVPGLANFNNRFGFNSSILVLSAAFTFSTFFNQSLYIINALISLVFFIWLIKISFEHKGIVSFISLFFIYFFFEQYTLDISSPGTDLMPNILASFIFIKLLILGYNFKEKYLLYIIIPFFCITLKLSMTPVIVLSLFALHQKNKNKIFILKNTLIYAIVLVLPWIIRNIILTGYVLYPFEYIDLFNFDWKVPVENVVDIKKWVSSWARIPFKEHEEVLGKSFAEWFPIWWEAVILKNKILFYISILTPIFVLIKYFKNKLFFKKSFIFSIFICYLCFIFWFILAPDFRFSFSFILLLNSAIFFMFFEQIIAKIRYLDYVKFIFILSILLILIDKSFLLFTKDYKLDKINTYAILPKNYKKHVRRSGAEFTDNIYFNSKNEKIILYGVGPNNIQRCYDLVPCSPFLSNNLKLRGESLQDGFKFENKQ